MSQLRQATLLFLLKDNQILLAMKKRGFGQGHWNGVGGKLLPGESIEQAAIRECYEEIAVRPMDIQLVARLNFIFPASQSDWNQQVIVFIAKKWQGDPIETDEMAPQWFEVDKLPYDQMWPDDQFWLPLVLAGQKIKGLFEFDKDQKLVSHEVSKLT